MDDRPDNELLTAIANQEMPALSELYRRHQRRVYHFVLSKLNDPFTANDLLNDTMLEVWRSAGRFQGRARVTTWLLSIAHHKVLDLWRQQGRRQSTELDETMIDESPGADVEAVTLAVRDKERLAQCMARLSTEHREILHLVFFEELNYEEIGQIIGIPEGTVKSRVHHAKKLLKQHLTNLDRGAA
ncbi:sigma-70 family RNA polymerase sigma factor [Halomonas campisalis]|uniref:Sigma-70 family RNA polymerase sigma factor n=1 Tax=Billgrantia campisalis TaxID=74661 RepID=A0ABS9PBH9_9GAMM|nr:sigma-70 family RNA polymerase sigma factor [Halomonas campisalis]MCG6659091.1 sigma-70 family RNA polymerase sigma factor [Halomonas campisalis]MDR5863875.1 sigma-70 family RNA polymerase sigma factor [Halomonas campisalis]